MIRFALLVTSLALFAAAGCVRPGGRKPQPPANIATATRQAWSAHSARVADGFRQLAETPPKTVTEAAEFSVKIDEASRKQFRQDMGEIMQPSLPIIKDNNGEPTDDLDPLAARRVFGEIAKGLRK